MNSDDVLTWRRVRMNDGISRSETERDIYMGDGVVMGNRWDIDPGPYLTIRWSDGEVTDVRRFDVAFTDSPPRGFYDAILYQENEYIGTLISSELVEGKPRETQWLSGDADVEDSGFDMIQVFVLRGPTNRSRVFEYDYEYSEESAVLFTSANE